MELQKVTMNGERLIPSGAHMDDISIRRSGIAKVLWRKLNVEVPASEVIVNGVNIFCKGDFAVTNQNERTTFSFRIPSEEEIVF